MKRILLSFLAAAASVTSAQAQSPAAEWRRVAGAEPLLVVVTVPVESPLPAKLASTHDCAAQPALTPEAARLAADLAAVHDAAGRPRIAVTVSAACNMRAFARIAFGAASELPLVPSTYAGTSEPARNDTAGMRGIAKAFRDGFTGPGTNVLVLPATAARALEMPAASGDVVVWRLKAPGQAEAVLTWRWQDLATR